MKYLYMSIILMMVSIFHCNYSLNVEEPELLDYEVDIQQTPIQRGKEPPVPIIHVASAYGQEYSCLLPISKDVSENIPDIKELLKPMESGKCLTIIHDPYKYKLCFGRYIQQNSAKDDLSAEQNYFVVGTYDSDYDWSKDNEQRQQKFKEVTQRYHSQYYTNGSKCGSEGPPRVGEVQLYCEEDAADYIYDAPEPVTCHYILRVRTSRLCPHPIFKPPAKEKENSIPCHPLLNEEQYSSYWRKLKDN